MLAMLSVLFVLRTASSSIQPIMPLFVKQLAGADQGSVATLAGLTLGVAGFTSALASVGLGRLADRIGQRPVLIVAALGVGLLYLPQAAAQSTTQLIVLQALFGVAAGGVLPSANTIVANLTPVERRGAVYGFTAAAASVGGFVGPLGGSALAALADIRWVFLVDGVLMLSVGLWIAHVIRPDATYARSSQPSPAARDPATTGV